MFAAMFWYLLTLRQDIFIRRRARMMRLKTELKRPDFKRSNVIHMNNLPKYCEIMKGNENKWTGLALTTLLADTNISAGVRLMCPPLHQLHFHSVNQLTDRSIALLVCRYNIITAN